jgi:hypothetical protein
VQRMGKEILEVIHTFLKEVRREGGREGGSE